MRPGLQRSKQVTAAFGLVETLIVVSIIGILAALVLPRINGVHSAIRSTKLQSDVKTINSAIDTYLANGGKLDGITDAQTIINKLKTTRTDADAITFVGYSGSMIEKRLAAKPLSDDQIGSSAPRAVWNPAKNHFELASSGAGVKEFYLDPALAVVDFGKENRQESSLKWNSKDGWVWAYVDGKAPPASGPTVVVTDPTPDTNPPLPPVPVQLTAPSFLPPGGTFPLSSFPLSVTLNNPNPPSTWIMLSTDGGATWNQFTGSVQVDPEDQLQVYADGDPAQWIKSATIGAYYRAPDPQTLDPPLINLSDTAFSDSVTEIQVMIANPNPPGISKIRYAMKGPDDTFPPYSQWLDYSAPILVNSTDYPNGMEIQAYAASLDPVSWNDSGLASESVGATFFEVPLTDDLLLILDASGSMNADFGGISRFEAVVQEAVKAIGSLPSSLKFNIAMFDSGIHWTDGTFELHPATLANKQAMIDQLLQVSPGGGTNYEAGLAFPLMFTPIPKMVVFLSDGRPSSKWDYSDELQALVNLGIPVHTIGIDLNGSALQNLQDISAATGGQSIQVSAP